MGCVLCADAAARRATAKRGEVPLHQRGAEVGRRAGKRCPPAWRVTGGWGRFDARPFHLQAEHIRTHSCTDKHKLVVRAFLCPAEPAVLALQANASDDELLRGAVPQPEDWLRNWRGIRNGDSWSSLELHSLTENWISQRRHRQVMRRAHAAMALVQREVLRMRKRDWIRESKSISLSFDDRKAHKLVVFNCDMPLDHRGASGVPVRHGMVGCLDMVHGESAESMDEDYAVRTCEKIMAMIKKFATPLGESSPDAAVVAKFVDGTQSIVCDGAMQKTAVFLANRFFKGVLLVCRDPAHMVRIATQEPLVRSARFEEQNIRLFTGRHALLKDIQYSEQTQARMQAAQERVLVEKGEQGGGIKRVLRHFSVAMHRWESFAGPRKMYVCLLNAIFMMLADIYNEDRYPKWKRMEALKCLEAMTARDILECGVAADYSDLCLRCAGNSERNRWVASSTEVLRGSGEQLFRHRSPGPWQL